MHQAKGLARSWDPATCEPQKSSTTLPAKFDLHTNGGGILLPLEGCNAAGFDSTPGLLHDNFVVIWTSTPEVRTVLSAAGIILVTRGKWCANKVCEEVKATTERRASRREVAIYFCGVWINTETRSPRLTPPPHRSSFEWVKASQIDQKIWALLGLGKEFSEFPAQESCSSDAVHLELAIQAYLLVKLRPTFVSRLSDLTAPLRNCK